METTAVQKVLIDSDTGLDDAMAFVHGMLSDQIDIVGIVTSYGNGSLEDCTNHALELVGLMGKQIPVVRGASRPLIDGCGPAPQVHGTYARGPLGKIDLSDRVTPGYGPIYMLEQIRKYGKDLAIVSMGRATNLALAYRIDPEVMKTVGVIYWMGGAIAASGNTSPVAEANVHGDPEAAKIICDPELPLTILSLDVTMHARITNDDVQVMGKVDHPGVQHLAKVVPYYIDFYETIYGVRECAGHVGLLLALAMDPTLITKSYTLSVGVETSGDLTRGMLVVDRRKLRALGEPKLGSEPGVRVIFGADTDRYHQMFMNAILGAKFQAG